LTKQLQIVAAFVAAAGWGSFALAQTPSSAAKAQAQTEDDDVEIPAAAPAPKASAAADAPLAPPPAPSAEDVARDAELARAQAESARRIEALEARLAVLAAAPKPAPPPPPRPVAEVNAESDARGEREGVANVLPAPGFLLSGYAQGQYLASGASQDQLQQGGALLNEDQFVVQRARLRADRRWTWAALSLELDGNTRNGLSFGIRRAEASLLWDREGNGAPVLMLTAGLFYVPFGYELPASARNRFFMERSLASTAFFPGQGDVGVRLAGSWRFLRYAVALTNGEPISESTSRPYRGDPNAAKDLVARVGVDTAPASRLRIAGGVSFLDGKGFHAGSSATKNGTVWVDGNEDGIIQSSELTPVIGASATPSANFRHWAVGADLRLTVTTPLGLTRLGGEVIVGSNLDRGLFVADPIANGNLDVRQLGFYASLVQDVFSWGLVGFRIDLYNPNADVRDTRAGLLLPANQTITTLSPIIGARVGERTRLVVQYDRVQDNLARDQLGVPTDLKNDQLTARLQVDL
jgi:hypothetical protein